MNDFPGSYFLGKSILASIFFPKFYRPIYYLYYNTLAQALTFFGL
jgi:hypothetical protein